MRGDLILLIALMPVVLASALSDLRQLKIRNTHVLTAIGFFAALAPFLLDGTEIASRILVAALIFAVCFFLFALRVIGGGDSKMLAVVMLFVPSTDAVQFLRIFAVALAVVSLSALMLQNSPAIRVLSWSSIQKKRHVPVGVAIAISVALLVLSFVLSA